MEYFRLYTPNPNPRDIDRIVGALRDGAVMIYPTDTLYAIGCDALNVRAVERICRIKSIDPQKAVLSIVCPDFSMLSRYARVSDTHFRLMRRNLPGAFTFILPASSQLPRIYKHRKSVGIRIPDNAIAQEITRQLGNPLLSASIDPQCDETEYLTDTSLIQELYGNAIDLFVDGGDGGTEPSTIVDCCGDTPQTVRQGKGILIE